MWYEAVRSNVCRIALRNSLFAPFPAARFDGNALISSSLLSRYTCRVVAIFRHAEVLKFFYVTFSELFPTCCFGQTLYGAIMLEQVEVQ